MSEQRESLEYDVVIVGAGPAGLAAAIRLRQLAASAARECSVCVLEKGSEVGAHILSGAVIETRALDELIPDWKARGAPLETPVAVDEFYFLSSPSSAVRVPRLFVPASMHNAGNHVVSLGALCRWLAAQAEALGAEIFPGFAAAEVLFSGDGTVRGVRTGDMGIAADGSRKAGYTPGMELRAKITLFTEGSRGHLGRRLIERFGLAAGRDPQHYGLGIKELWEVPAKAHRPGLVMHGAGWPLSGGASGGFFLYHAAGRQIAVGLIVDLNYSNPWLSPYEEFQRLKTHPLIAGTLAEGRRVAYGARAITKGGLNSLPRLSMPGALIAGCDAGTLNFAKIKGTHTAMKSGMVAAETIMEAFSAGRSAEPGEFDARFRASWAFEELERARNFGPALHALGLYGGSAFNFLEQTLCRGRLPFTLHDRQSDHESLKPTAGRTRIDYPKPDGKFTFDRLSSVYLSNTNHEEDQPCHLTLRDPSLPVEVNLARYGGPEQRYCPAGVYEFIGEGDARRLQINAQNCVHCKTCDIKDPEQNIVWIAPEGGGGPNYPNM
jgi:electron-transferring-flavoprotein dehydrogenase